MKINNRKYQSIWYSKDDNNIKIINQNKLPFHIETLTLSCTKDVINAISKMKVRGAPLIGCTGAFGVYLSCKKSSKTENIEKDCEDIVAARPTAVNLKWAVRKVKEKIFSFPSEKRESEALNEALLIMEEDIHNCKLIGVHGSEVIKQMHRNNNSVINILTHCNAGWLATVDWGTATSPIYHAKRAGIDIHVWVDETRPRFQGAQLTSFELNNENVENTIISDNTGGYLMYKKRVDMCITGADRIMSNGDVFNKIGTYEKALVAQANNIPFYVAAPVSTIDFSESISEQIVIEERSENEMKIFSYTHNGKYQEFDIYPKNSKCLNIAFDITPSKLITGLICEYGIFECNREGIEKIRRELSK